MRLLPLEETSHSTSTASFALAMRNWLENEGSLEETITSVVCRLAAVFPFPTHENREIWIQCLPHTQVTSVSQICTNKTAEARLLFNVANSYSELAKYEDAEQMLRQALELCEKTLGREHPDTATSLDNLGRILGNQGKYEEAEQMLRQALEINEKDNWAESIPILLLASGTSGVL